MKLNPVWMALGSVVVIIAGPASRLSMARQPSAIAEVGVPFRQQPSIQLRDAAGKVTQQAGIVVTATIASGGGALGGSVSTTTNPVGTATFSNLSIQGAPGVRSLIFSAPALSAVASADINVTAVGAAVGAPPVIVSPPAAAAPPTSNPRSVDTPRAPPPAAVAAATPAVPGTLSGHVTTATGTPVAGGTVELVMGTRVSREVAVGADGVYTFSSLAPGTYEVRLQPPVTHSMGHGEPGTRRVVVPSGGTATQAFTVMPAMWVDDFHSYADTRQLLAGCNKATGSAQPGSFFAGAGRDLSCVNGISLETDNHFSNPNVLRYDWPARPPRQPLADYCRSEYTVGLMPRFNPPPKIEDTLWVRLTSKESPGFLQGSRTCAASVATSYKFLLVNIGPTVGEANGRFGAYISSAASLKIGPPMLVLDVNDRHGNYLGTGSPTLGANFFGDYHTWTFQMFNMGTPRMTFRAYLDGQQIAQIIAPFYPGGATIGGPGQVLTLEIGANINNGPELAQSRWIKDVGLYFSRPNMKPIQP